MKKSLSLLLCLFSTTLLMADDFLSMPVAKADETKWLENYADALKQAGAKKKWVLMNFTGSDWCPYCILLDKEIFNQKKFQEYASKNLVLLKVDFPIKTVLSDDLRKQNESLQGQFNVYEFPTVLVLNSKGKVLGKLGYMQGGPSKFIEALENLKK